nr:FkbM family methyltransferase [Paracoccus sp. S1E-3]
MLEALKPERRTRVVDIGANPLTAPPYKLLMDLDGCDVWGFEPQQSAYEDLIKLAGPREHYLPHAVGDGGDRVLNVCKASGFTSMLEPNVAAFDYLGRFHRQGRVIQRIPFSTSRLDDLDMPQVDLVKIDIQGGERTVFENGRRMLGGAVAVITEVAAIPLYVDQPLLDAQMAELRESGYHLHKFMTFWAKPLKNIVSDGRARAVRSQLIDGDAVFVRALLELNTQDTEWLKHLAVLSDGVFASFDLTVLVLQLLLDRRVITEAQLDTYMAKVVNG